MNTKKVKIYRFSVSKYNIAECNSLKNGLYNTTSYIFLEKTNITIFDRRCIVNSKQVFFNIQFIYQQTIDVTKTRYIWLHIL